MRAPLRAPAGHGLPGHADPAGPATVNPCPWRSPGRRMRRLSPAHPPPARRQTGAPLIGLPGRKAGKSVTACFDHSLARNAMVNLPHAFFAWVPSAAPSSAGSRRGKAPLFERMDARVGAGRRVPSNAGHRHSVGMAARKWGRLLFGYFLLANQEKVTRAARRAERNAVDLDLAVKATGPFAGQGERILCARTGPRTRPVRC